MAAAGTVGSSGEPSPRSRNSTVVWSPARLADVPGVAWTRALGLAPRVRAPAVRTLLAAWLCVGTLVATAVTGGRGWYVAAGGRVAVRLARWRGGWGGLAAIPLFMVLLRLVDEAVVRRAAGVLYGYVFSFGMLLWVRWRQDTTAAERNGVVRLGGFPSADWYVTRIAVRAGDPADEIPAVVELVDTRTRPGDVVGTYSRTATMERAFYDAGFTDAPGERGRLVRTTPG